ncbi:MAG: SMP-30/gluconolactonase/LRE family protein [Acidimicrobiia bacterium]|nr:SMP-30/gluconolactonase/LRE family protein [Acidimicrobiia bacterium]
MQRPIEVMAEGLGHPEGPDMLPDGRVVFVETYTSDVKVREDGKGGSVYRYCGGGTNACIVGGDGDVYVTQNGGTVGAWKARDQVTPSIQRIRPDGTVNYVATEIEGVALNAPNDLAFGPNGSLYFTDSGEWDQVNKPDPSRIFELFPDGTGRVLQELEPVYTRRLGGVVHAGGPAAAPRRHDRAHLHAPRRPHPRRLQAGRGR